MINNFVSHNDDVVEEVDEMSDEEATLADDLLDEVVGAEVEEEEELEGFGILPVKEEEDEQEEKDEDEDGDEALEDDAEDVEFDTFDDVDEL